jgi:cell division septation protein DedD
MIKSRGRNGTASVTFTLAGAVGASQAAICGEWNNWSPDRDVMEPAEDGFAYTVELEVGRTYRFRYLLDGHRWENDWAADSYVPNDHGGDDSLVDLTVLEAEPAPNSPATKAPAKKAPAKKAEATKATPAKKAAPTKTAVTAKKAAPRAKKTAE